MARGNRNKANSGNGSALSFEATVWGAAGGFLKSSDTLTTDVDTILVPEGETE